jgi:hypothetical protein
VRVQRRVALVPRPKSRLDAYRAQSAQGRYTTQIRVCIAQSVSRYHEAMRYLALTILACGTNPDPVTFGGGADAGLTDATTSKDSALPTTPDAADGAVPPPARPYDWVQIISTGQSLSIGSQGLPPNPAPQPYQNLVLSDSSPDPKFDNDGDQLSLVRLVSPLRTATVNMLPAGTYPNNINGETVSEGLSNQLSALSLARAGRDYVTVATAVGQGGRQLSVIEKQPGPAYPAKPAIPGNQAYWASMYETTRINELARAAGRRFGVGAVFLTHGESDALLLTPAASYEAGVVKLAKDYDADTRAITGQSTPVLLFTSQQGTYPAVIDAISTTINGLWRVSIDNPDRIVCVGPKYQYEYTADRVHLPAAAYERVGTKYAEAYYQTVLEGKRWRPLEPMQVTRVGRTITVSLYVPFPPLSWDTVFPPPHQSAMHPWRNGKSFEVATQSGAKLEIESVALEGPSSVKVTLTQEPSAGTALVVRHAIVQDVAGAQGGMPEGRHGLLRDTDPLVPRDARVLDVSVKNGSAVITAKSTGAFARQTVHDRVTLPGVAGEFVVVARAGDTLTLSAPVALADSDVKATIMSDQRNYLVHFELPLP